MRPLILALAFLIVPAFARAAPAGVSSSGQPAGTMLGEAQYTITGDFIADGTALLFTSDTEVPGLTVTSHSPRASWPNPREVSFQTSDRYLYIVAWGGNGGQGLLHDLSVIVGDNSYPIFSGNEHWKVVPADSTITTWCPEPCETETKLVGSLTIRIPGAAYVSPTLGCFNPAPATPDCYTIYGGVASIDLGARWMWFNSGLQTTPNAPFHPDFNHREFLIFSLDLKEATEPPTTGVDDVGSRPALRAWPNPSSGPSVSFTLSSASKVKLEVYNLAGRRVRVLADSPHSEGHHILHWDGLSTDGTRLSPGMYFIRLTTNQARRVTPVVLLN